MYKMPSRISR